MTLRAHRPVVVPRALADHAGEVEQVAHFLSIEPQHGRVENLLVARSRGAREDLSEEHHLRCGKAVKPIGRSRLESAASALPSLLVFTCIEIITITRLSIHA